MLVIAAVLGGAVYFFGTMAVGQVQHMLADLPKSADATRAYLQERAWGKWVLDNTPPVKEVFTGGGKSEFVSRIGGFFTTTFGVLGNLLVLTALALYLAASPQTYLSGVRALVPPRHRGRAEQVMTAIGTKLKWWLIGRVTAMVAVGLITGVGLWLIGVPQFLVLALVAGVLTAVPFIGPIVAAIPGILLAFLQGPTTAAWAVGVYLLSQLIENYLVTPLVQQQTVNMPPVLTIAALTLVGAVFGILGLIVATPLAVAIKVAVEMLYFEDVLGDDTSMRENGRRS